MSGDPRGWFAQQSIGVGMITPSANVVVERITTAIMTAFPQVSAHFARVPVIGAPDPAQDDYDWPAMMRAAELLGHARPAAICWNGSKGGAIGIDRDRDLCAWVTAMTGLPSTTSTLAILRSFAATDVRRFGLVTPYTSAYAAVTPPHFAREGFDCIAGAHAGLSDNLAYAGVPAGDIAAMIRSVAASRPDAIIAYCTNLPAAGLVADLEAELGLPIYDSVSIGVAETLRLAGVAPAPGAAWGSAFTDPRLELPG